MSTTDTTHLAADALRQDPRIAEAKRLIREAVSEHQAVLEDVRPAAPARKQSYEEFLEGFRQVRGAKLWYPYVGSGLGKGSLVELADGSVKFDMIGGIGVHIQGHSHLDVIDSCVDAALDDTVMQGNLQQNREALEVCQDLCTFSGFQHCFLTSSGVMANENALKMAMQKNAPAQRILAFDHCFMGRTIAISQVTDKPLYRDGIPPVLHVDYIPFFDPSHPEESTEAALHALKGHLKRYPKQHAVMSFELVQGEGGFNVGERTFFRSIMKLLKHEGIAILADEVQSFGRTEQLFAFQHFGLEDLVDIVTVGKMGQVCATLWNDEYQPRGGLVAQTFTSSCSAIRAGHCILHKLVHGGHFGPEGRNAQINQRFAQNLQAISERHPDKLRGPYGVGVMVGCTPYDGDAKKVTELLHRLYDNGVIAYGCGSKPMRLRFLVPALAVTDRDIDRVCEIVAASL